jgi:hypothetical protein
MQLITIIISIIAIPISRPVSSTGHHTYEQTDKILALLEMGGRCVPSRLCISSGTLGYIVLL